MSDLDTFMGEMSLEDRALDCKNQGNAALASNDAPEAIRCYTESIACDPTNKVYFSNRSAAYIVIGDFSAALEDGESCISQDKNWAKGYFRKGTALQAMGEYTDAAECLTIGLSKEPGNKMIKEALVKANKYIKFNPTELEREMDSRLIIMCQKCEKVEDLRDDGVPFKKCKACKSHRYCSRDCQVSDWDNHKKRCGKGGPPQNRAERHRELKQSSLQLVEVLQASMMPLLLDAMDKEIPMEELVAHLDMNESPAIVTAMTYVEAKEFLTSRGVPKAFFRLLESAREKKVPEMPCINLHGTNLEVDVTNQRVFRLHDYCEQILDHQNRNA